MSRDGDQGLSIATALCALALTSCSGSAIATTSFTPPLPPTSTAELTTTTTSNPTSTEPVATLPAGSIGDPATLAEARESALRGIRLSPESFPPGAIDIEIPWPDTTNPDPVAALRSIWEFDAWVASTLPYDRLAKLYLVEGSPAWNEAGEFIEQLDANQWIVDFDGPGFEWVAGEVASSALLPDSVQAPVGAVVVKYRSTQSSLTVRWLEDETHVRSSDGYPEEDSLALVQPTDTGWRVYWYGSIS